MTPERLELIRSIVAGLAAGSWPVELFAECERLRQENLLLLGTKGNPMEQEIAIIDPRGDVANVIVRKADRETDFVKNDTTTPHKYTVLIQGDQKIVVWTHKLREALEDLNPPPPAE